MIKCPNGCQVLPDALSHNCSRHQRAIEEGKLFKCKIKNCSLSQLNQPNTNKETTNGDKVKGAK